MKYNSHHCHYIDMHCMHLSTLSLHPPLKKRNHENILATQILYGGPPLAQYFQMWVCGQIQNILIMEVLDMKKFAKHYTSTAAVVSTITLTVGQWSLYILIPVDLCLSSLLLVDSQS